MSTQASGLTRKQIEYLEFLSGKERPAMVSGVTPWVLWGLFERGLIESIKPDDERPLIMCWWKITVAGREVVEALWRTKAGAET